MKKTNKKFNWKKFWTIVMVTCFISSAVLFIAGVSVAAVADQPQGPVDTTNPGDETTNPGDETTNPGDETTNPGDETTNPGDETTNPGDETTNPGDETTNPGDETTNPGDETTNPGDETTNPGDETTAPEKTEVDIATFGNGKHLVVYSDGTSEVVDHLETGCVCGK